MLHSSSMKVVDPFPILSSHSRQDRRLGGFPSLQLPLYFLNLQTTTPGVTQVMKKTQLTKFTNCRILKDSDIIRENLWVRDGVIVDPEMIFYEEQAIPDVVIDLNDAIIAPGFIDLQVNGSVGFDFSCDLVNGKPEGLRAVAQYELTQGVTSFCPTLVTSKTCVYTNTLPLIKKQAGGLHGASILGAHLEGPFINPEKKGAHSEQEISRFEHGVNSLLDTYSDLTNVAIVTLAPELPNSSEVIDYLVRRGIVVSLGHSSCNLSQAEVAAKRGANLITHLFNAMLPFHHRDPGLIGLLTNSTNSIYYGIIADGAHTHPAALRIAYRAHPKGLVLVTDAISASGLETGRYSLGGRSIELRGGHAYIADTNTLCGSTATMNECVRIFKSSVECSMAEALEAASLIPAKVLGIDDRKGSLAYGKDADLVIINDNLDVLSTWIAGKCVYGNLVS